MRGAPQFQHVLAGSDRQIVQLPHPCLTIYAQNHGGRPALLIRHSHDLDRTVDGTRGIRVNRTKDGKTRYLIFESESAGMTPLFAAVVDTLVQESEGGQDEADAVSRVLTSFDALREMFAARGGRLREDSLRGLFAELLLLRGLRAAGWAPVAASIAWQGPYRAAKDFVLADAQCVEVKSIRRMNHHVKIANVDQLDPRGENLRLAVFELDRSVGEDAVGLLELCAEIDSWMATDPVANVNFDDAITALGFDRNDDYYDQWSFAVGQTKWFEVTEEFPRVKPEDVPGAISNVTYRLDIDDLAGFESTPPWEGVTGA